MNFNSSTLTSFHTRKSSNNLDGFYLIELYQCGTIFGCYKAITNRFENTLTLSDQILVSKILATNEFSNFIEAARKFCSFIETYQPDTPRNFIMLTQNHLLTLYNVGNNLLDVEEKSSKTFENQLDEKEYHKTLHFIADRLYDYRYYWYVFDPTSKKKDIGVIYGDVYEDLGTIYKFLKQSLLLFGLKHSAAKQNAIWDFKWYFDKHWSTHCANGIYAIHHFLQKDR